jgi:hypothetical protein
MNWKSNTRTKCELRLKQSIREIWATAQRRPNFAELTEWKKYGNGVYWLGPDGRPNLLKGSSDVRFSLVVRAITELTGSEKGILKIMLILSAKPVSGTGE